MLIAPPPYPPPQPQKKFKKRQIARFGIQIVCTRPLPPPPALAPSFADWLVAVKRGRREKETEKRRKEQRNTSPNREQKETQKKTKCQLFF